MTRRLVLLLSALVACSSSDAEDEGETDAGSMTSSTSGDQTSAGSETGQPDPSSESGTTTEDSSETTDGGSEGGESSSGGDDPPAPDYATPYFPLQVGLQWQYRLTRTDGSTGSSCIDNGEVHLMEMTSERGGVFTRTEEPYCYFASVDFRIDGEYIDVNNGAWYHQLLLPPSLDATWPAGGASGASYIWDEHHESYTVQAGTFNDCWRRKQQGYDVWEIYCRDVGMVESFYDAWGSNTRSELIGFGG